MFTGHILPVSILTINICTNELDFHQTVGFQNKVLRRRKYQLSYVYQIHF